MNTQLLCTFTTNKKLDQTLMDISSKFNVIYEKIYVLQNEDKHNELICTYNVEKNRDLDFNGWQTLFHYIGKRLQTHYTR